MPSTYSERFRQKPEGKPQVSVADAIKVLAGAAKSPQQQALVKNAYRAFEGQHDAPQTQVPDRNTPGGKAARDSSPLPDSAKEHASQTAKA